MPPTLFIIGKSGAMMVLPGKISDEGSKDQIAEMARFACTAFSASSCVLAMEAWMKMAKPGETLDLTERPSEAFDREEVIVLSGEDRTQKRHQILRLIRSDNGNFFGLDDSTPPQMRMEGRFSGLLPENVPDAEAQELAQTMLKFNQAKVVRLGNGGRLRG